MSIKEAKKNFIVDEAIGLFLERSVSVVTIRDVARRSGVGEATIYRYFSGRTGLIVACALRLQTQAEERFLGAADAVSGYERLACFYRAYLDTFLEKPELYRFLSEFDAFCISQGALDLEEYADHLDRFKEAFADAYAQGLADGTVRPVADLELFYYATTHAILSLCKKLAVGDGILRQDRLTDKAMELRTLLDLILSSLKKT